MQFQNHCENAREILCNYLGGLELENNFPKKIPIFAAIDLIALKMGVRKDTARAYLERIFETYPKLKTDSQNVWLE